MHLDFRSLTKEKIQDEVSKLKIQREMLETLRGGLSDSFFSYAPFDTCVRMLFDMIHSNIREYRAISNKAKSLFKLTNCSCAFVDCPLTTIFDVEFLNTADGIAGFCRIPSKSGDDIYAQKRGIRVIIKTKLYIVVRMEEKQLVSCR